MFTPMLCECAVNYTNKNRVKLCQFIQLGQSSWEMSVIGLEWSWQHEHKMKSGQCHVANDFEDFHCWE